ncbi:MAG: response regulator [Gammaproteobacteria bacterium]
MQRGLYVLICARDEIASRRLSHQLLEQGVHCEWARTAKAGIARLTSEEFDALAIDLILPDQDGISLIQDIRSLGYNIPIIGLSLRSSVRPALTPLHAAVKQAGTNEAADRARTIFAIKVATQRVEGYHPRVLALTSDERSRRLTANTLGHCTQLVYASTLADVKTSLEKSTFDFALADPEFFADDTTLQSFASLCPDLPVIIHTLYQIQSHSDTPPKDIAQLIRVIRTYAMLGHQAGIRAHA